MYEVLSVIEMVVGLLLRVVWMCICQCGYGMACVGWGMSTDAGRLVCFMIAVICSIVSISAMSEAGEAYIGQQSGNNFRVYNYLRTHPMECNVIQSVIFVCHVLFLGVYRKYWVTNYRRYVLNLERLHSQLTFPIICVIITIKFRSSVYDMSFEDAARGFISFIYSLVFLSFAALDYDDFGIIETITVLALGFGLHLHPGALGWVTIAIIIFPKLVIYSMHTAFHIYEISFVHYATDQPVRRRDEAIDA